MRQIGVNGLSLAVHDEGEGPPVLLVHGFPDCHDVWRKQIPVLVAAGYRVIALDTRGCGDSDAPKGSRNYRPEAISPTSWGCSTRSASTRCGSWATTWAR